MYTTLNDSAGLNLRRNNVVTSHLLTTLHSYILALLSENFPTKLMGQRYPMQVKRAQENLQQRHPYENLTEKVGSVKLL